MYVSLETLVPDANDFLSLQVEEAAAVLLTHLHCADLRSHEFGLLSRGSQVQILLGAPIFLNS
jgi:hypothetical protein